MIVDVVGTLLPIPHFCQWDMGRKAASARHTPAADHFLAPVLIHSHWIYASTMLLWFYTHLSLSYVITGLGSYPKEVTDGLQNCAITILRHNYLFRLKMLSIPFPF